MDDTNCAFTALDDGLFVSRGCYGNKDGIPIIFDSGCTHAITPHASDFIGKIILFNKLMNGLGATVNIVDEGTVGWSFRDDYGVKRKVQVKSYHVTANKVRLFSLLDYFVQEIGGSFTMNVEGILFNFANGGTLSFKYSSSSLPISYASIVKPTSPAGYIASTGRADISKTQEELLL